MPLFRRRYQPPPEQPPPRVPQDQQSINEKKYRQVMSAHRTEKWILIFYGVGMGVFLGLVGYYTRSGYIVVLASLAGICISFPFLKHTIRVESDMIVSINFRQDKQTGRVKFITFPHHMKPVYSYEGMPPALIDDTDGKNVYFVNNFDPVVKEIKAPWDARWNRARFLTDKNFLQEMEEYTEDLQDKYQRLVDNKTLTVMYQVASKLEMLQQRFVDSPFSMIQHKNFGQYDKIETGDLKGQKRLSLMSGDPEEEEKRLAERDKVRQAQQPQEATK